MLAATASSRWSLQGSTIDTHDGGRRQRGARAAAGCVCCQTTHPMIMVFARLQGQTSLFKGGLRADAIDGTREKFPASLRSHTDDAHQCAVDLPD